jgi:hypothetical protein
LFFSEGEARRSLRSELNTLRQHHAHTVSTTSTCSHDVWNIDMELVRTRFHGSMIFHIIRLHKPTVALIGVVATLPCELRYDAGSIRSVSTVHIQIQWPEMERSINLQYEEGTLIILRNEECGGLGDLCGRSGAV